MPAGNGWKIGSLEFKSITRNCKRLRPLDHHAAKGVDRIRTCVSPLEEEVCEICAPREPYSEVKGP